VVKDVEELALFTSTVCFKGWYNMLIAKRNEYIDANKYGGSSFVKMSMNSVFGYDLLNEEKYTHSKLVD
jgi:hypothetical protein